MTNTEESRTGAPSGGEPGFATPLQGQPEIGDMAPSFELTSDKGDQVRLSNFRGKRIILYFYPKAGTKG